MSLSDNMEKLRQQYDFLPYPESSLDYSPQNDLQELFIHSGITPYYLRYQQVVDPKGMIILDAGCGSGLKSLALALANPDAKIVGVDISAKSIELARQRLDYHGFKNVEFYPLSLEEITSLGYQFDYINCDEVLYLLTDPAAILRIFRNVLKPRGIIRANLHSYYQRNAFFRCQEAFKFLGLFDEESIEISVEIVEETLTALHDFVQLKQLFKDYKNQQNPSPSQIKEWILVNYLIRGDKGYTIKEMFDFLDIAGLNFISMVNWRQWHFPSLFKGSEDLSLFWQLELAETGEKEQLQLFELFHPIHRLLDFWVVKDDIAPTFIAPGDWQEVQWQTCRVYLHPILANPKTKADLQQAVAKRVGFQISQYIPLPTASPIIIDSLLAASLLPLWDSPQPLSILVNRWLQLQPHDPLTLNTKPQAQAQQEIQSLLTALETFTYVLLVQD